MIPSAFVPIESLPLSPNGKVDRSALLRAQPLEFGDADSVLSPVPLTDLEQAISAIWQQVLNCGIGTNDNFFDFGGDSLQVIEMHSELQKMLGRELSITDLFEYTTVRSLANRLRHEAEPEPAVSQAHDRANKQRHPMARQEQMMVSP